MIDLCAKVHFRATRTVRDGVGYVGLMSSHRTQVNGAGACKRICAAFVLNAGLGVIGVSLMSEGRLCYGGFAPIGGSVQGALHGVLVGHVVIFSTRTTCIPELGAVARAVDCTDAINPPDPLCLRSDAAGEDCIFCVDHTNPRTTCTIFQDRDQRPCSPLALPGGCETLVDGGVIITPEPGMFDINGDDQSFEAGEGTAGLVRFYLQEEFHALIDPLYQDPDNPSFCDRCGNWMCAFITHYLSQFDAWEVHCTDVLKLPVAGNPDNPGGACCRIVDGEMVCTDETEFLCAGLNGVWQGPGSRCGCIDCGEIAPEPGFLGACCLIDGQCFHVSEQTCGCIGGVSWTPGVQCGDVSCAVADPNLMPRHFGLFFQTPIGFFRANLSFGGGDVGRCFQLIDQNCMSTGPLSGKCGGGAAPTPCWHHLQDGDVAARVLDGIAIVADMRLAETSGDAVNLHPHGEPECVAISNAALKMVGDLMLRLDRDGRRRAHSVNKVSINHWEAKRTWDCGSAPVVWPVSVRPYRTPCSFAADLVMVGVFVDLWLSGDPSSSLVEFNEGDCGFLRVAARLFCHVDMRIRLRLGWETNGCPIAMANAIESPCDPVLSDPNHAMIFASDACSRVPLSVDWRGMVGPRPWSRGNFGHGVGGAGSDCKALLCAINELVIPGEVNRTADPDGPQRYEGDVVLVLTTLPEGWCA